MTDKSYSIIFSSPTGNTRLLADAIRDALPEENCNYFGVSENADTQSDILFIGFWTDKGTADKATLDLLEKLKNKRIFLFGTAGFGGDEEYFKEILANTKKSISDSNITVGEYMCQGKMPQTVRERYIKMKSLPNPAPNLDMLIENFDRALSHPDENDLKRLKFSVEKL